MEVWKARQMKECRNDTFWGKNEEKTHNCAVQPGCIMGSVALIITDLSREGLDKDVGGMLSTCQDVSRKHPKLIIQELLV